MLEKLVIHNFESHEKRVVEFGALTCIVGDSDVGKSGFLRALSLVCANVPTGDAFIRWGEDNTKVTLYVDGHKVARQRGKAGNFYFLDGDEFKAFGNVVPDPIQDLLKLGDVNFQRQFDSPFWFGESAGGVSRRLNAIVNLEVIDSALGEVAGKLRTARTEFDLITERLRKARAEVEALAYVPAMEEQFDRLRELQSIEQRATANTATLRRAVESASSSARARKFHAEQLTLAEGVADAGDAWHTAQKKPARLRALLLEAGKHERAAQATPPSPAKAEAARATYVDAQAKAARLRKLVGTLDEQRSEIAGLAADLAKAHENLHKNFTGMVCPTCAGSGKLA